MLVIEELRRTKNRFILKSKREEWLENGIHFEVNEDKSIKWLILYSKENIREKKIDVDYTTRDRRPSIRRRRRQKSINEKKW